VDDLNTMWVVRSQLLEIVEGHAFVNERLVFCNQLWWWDIDLVPGWRHDRLRV